MDKVNRDTFIYRSTYNEKIDNCHIMATTYGDRLKEARRAKKMSQGRLAQLVGLKQPTVSGLEASGKGSSYTASFAKVLGVNPLWLSEGRGDKYPTQKKESANSSLKSPIGNYLGESNSNQNSPVHDSALSNTLSPDTVEVIKQLDKPSIEMLESLITNFSQCDQQGKEHLAFSGETAKSGSDFRANAKKAEQKKEILKGLDSDHTEAKPPTKRG